MSLSGSVLFAGVVALTTIDVFVAATVDGLEVAVAVVAVGVAAAAVVAAVVVAAVDVAVFCRCGGWYRCRHTFGFVPRTYFVVTVMPGIVPVSCRCRHVVVGAVPVVAYGGGGGGGDWIAAALKCCLCCHYRRCLCA